MKKINQIAVHVCIICEAGLKYRDQCPTSIVVHIALPITLLWKDSLKKS